MLQPEFPMVDMLLLEMDIDMPYQLMDILLQELPMVDMLLPAMDMPLPELPMVDMLIIAMGMDSCSWLQIWICLYQNCQLWICFT